jgi:hypothetical protein
MMLTGSYDKCVTAIREINKDDMAAVTATIFSHAQVRGTYVSYTYSCYVIWFWNSNICILCIGCQEEHVGHNAYWSPVVQWARPYRWTCNNSAWTDVTQQKWTFQSCSQSQTSMYDTLYYVLLDLRLQEEKWTLGAAFGGFPHPITGF